MNYIVFDIDKTVVHSESGIANNTSHIHERRTMRLSEVMLITDGEIFIHHLEDYHLVKNDIFFLPQGIEHYGTKPTDCQLHWHHFFLPTSASIVSQNDLDLVKPTANTLILPMQMNLKNPDTVFMLGYQLEQYSNASDETQVLRNALMTAIIADIGQSYKKQAPSSQHKRLNSIISYIDNNFQHHALSIKNIAEKFDYNEKYIYNLFKKYLNISPLQYIISRKLREARTLLLNSSDTIEAISLKLNYDNPQYFMKQFKNYFGMTPTEMRGHYSNSLELFLKPKDDEFKD